MEPPVAAASAVNPARGRLGFFLPYFYRHSRATTNIKQAEKNEFAFGADTIITK
jgi:hypothetical protein